MQIICERTLSISKFVCSQTGCSFDAYGNSAILERNVASSVLVLTGFRSSSIKENNTTCVPEGGEINFTLVDGLSADLEKLAPS